MRSVLISVLVCVSGCVVTQRKASTAHSDEAPTPSSLDSRAADRKAKDAFLKLNFFADGRGMHMTSGLIGSYKTLAWTGIYDRQLTKDWGAIKHDGQVIGLGEERFENQRIGVAGCAMCHTGRAAGQFIVGLGNKNIDTVKFGEGVAKFERLHAALTFKNLNKREVDASAVSFATRLANPAIGNLTQGLVPVSAIRTWFYTQANEALPADLHRSAVKVPALWGYGAKREAGQFCDGYGNGKLPGWLIGVELSAGQTAGTVRSYEAKLKAAGNIIASMLPPEYPFAVDHAAARRGSSVFSVNCKQCHGSYQRDASGLASWQKPKWVSLDEVGTDSDRLDANTPHFNELVDRSPLRDLIQRTPERRGYLAPRLEGIWCRFPYLHNGSVPSIAALLTPPESRPRVFSLHDAGERSRFDEQSLGLTTGPLKRCNKVDRALYDTQCVGQSNGGHDYGTALSAQDKRDLIEYLKTL